MVYRESGGVPVFNWQYVDMVYDHWLSIGIRPFVELGFMPYDLASGTETVFWWRGNITPPKDWARWELLVARFVDHVIERYGVEEVRRWYFEVWNEPNLEVFWKDADFPTYLELYERTAHVIKNIDAGLRVDKLYHADQLAHVLPLTSPAGAAHSHFVHVQEHTAWVHFLRQQFDFTVHDFINLRLGLRGTIGPGCSSLWKPLIVLRRQMRPLGRQPSFYHFYPSCFARRAAFALPRTACRICRRSNGRGGPGCH